LAKPLDNGKAGKVAGRSAAERSRGRRTAVGEGQPTGREAGPTVAANGEKDGKVVLSVRGLQTYFFGQRGVGKAVDGVSFDLHESETLGIVGESGCGKSVTMLSIMRLNPRPASRIVGGEVLLNGEDLLRKNSAEMRRLRGKYIAMVLQDPMTALNPVLTVGNQLYEPLRLHQRLRGRDLFRRAVELMRAVRIPAPEARLGSFPHQFSGGMRQRAVGAIGLSCDPQILIADEPTTSLDVTVQAAYLELLKELQRQSKLAILFITHDFGIVARMCDRVGVMYAGKIVELAETRGLFEAPAHPYTEALVNSVPDVSERVDRLASIEGQPPSIYNLASGCPFAPRCAYVQDRCRENYPAEKRLEDGRMVACWRYHD
jgi:oligopeptide/dipeptide ABC transporter ATP-binding protein